MRRLREGLLNLALTLLSLTIFAAICEFGVFRLVWLASDVPANDFIREVVRYAPNQRGVWRVRDEIAAPYAINAQGWNSGSGDYAIPRRPGVPRVAVVGDSYVEALQVPFDRSVGERLAAALGNGANLPEVDRFGISGAPLSQYVQIAEREVVRYRPDWVVVLLVHNDFDESYRFKPGRYTSSFLKFRVGDGQVLGDIAPEPWLPGRFDALRRTATARFFLYRWQARPDFLIDLLLPQAQAAAGFAANADIVTILADRRTVEAVTEHAFGRLDAAARTIGARVLLAMDADRFAIYRGQESLASELNRLAAAAAARQRVPFVDLERAFMADWRTRRQRFDYDADHHWNEHGHAVAAEAIAGALRAEGWR